MQSNVKILLIEDDTDDIELLEEAFQDNNIRYEMDIVMEGDKVQLYMQTNELPDVIVLDFNLPKVHGREVLQIIKANERFKNIPLIVLTTSAAREDIDFAYTMGAKQFLTKPTTLADFNSTVNIIIQSSATVA
jgi:CheY-like chemotaxis protein